MNDILTALQQGTAPAIVVTIYLIITKIIDSKRDKAQVKLSSELVKSVGIISDYINDITKDIYTRNVRLRLGGEYMNPKIQWLRNTIRSLDMQGMIVSNPIDIKYSFKSSSDKS